MIYILPVAETVRPSSQPFRYPNHNDDYGVEQDFLSFLHENPEWVTAKPGAADYHYLPVFWTRWHLSHHFGADGLDELQTEINRAVLDDSKTFTVCQYSDGPLIDLGNTRLFLTSRRTAQGIDIPLLCAPHQTPAVPPAKRYLASFVGSMATHPVREEISKICKDREDILLKDGNYGSKYFVRKILQSYISLCPRGYGGSSFRFFESMQLGVVPFLIGDPDTRPFKDYINWSQYSLYAPNPDNLLAQIDNCSKQQLQTMGKFAAKLWANELSYRKWCRLLVKTLTDIK